VNGVQELPAGGRLGDVNTPDREVRPIERVARNKLIRKERQIIDHILRGEVSWNGEAQQRRLTRLTGLRIRQPRAGERSQSVTRRTEEDPLVELEEADIRRGMVQ